MHPREAPGPSTRIQNICTRALHQDTEYMHPREAPGVSTRTQNIFIMHPRDAVGPSTRTQNICIMHPRDAVGPSTWTKNICIMHPRDAVGPTTYNIGKKQSWVLATTVVTMFLGQHIVDCRLSYIQYVPYDNFVSTPGLSIFCVFGCHRRPNALSHCRCYDAKKLSLAQLCSKFVPKVDHCSGKICLCFVSKGLKKIVVYNNSKPCNVQ